MGIDKGEKTQNIVSGNRPVFSSSSGRHIVLGVFGKEDWKIQLFGETPAEYNSASRFRTAN